MNKNEVRIGDKIWFQESWTDRITYGIVTEISDNGVRLDGVSRDDNSFIGSSGKTCTRPKMMQSNVSVKKMTDWLLNIKL